MKYVDEKKFFRIDPKTDDHSGMHCYADFFFDTLRVWRKHACSLGTDPGAGSEFCGDRCDFAAVEVPAPIQLARWRKVVKIVSTIKNRLKSRIFSTS